MDGQRFDDLTRALGSPASRRSVVAGLAGLAGGLFASATASAQNGCTADQVYRRGQGCVCRTTGRPPENGVCPCPNGQINCGGHCAQCCANADCEDGDRCTANSCRNGRCRRERLVCPATDRPCHDAVCDSASGACVDVPRTDGTPCDDPDPCNRNGVCAAGVCHGTPLDCSGSDGPCTVGRCHPLSGGCEPAPLDDETPCAAPEDLCAELGVCRTGVCEAPQRQCLASADCQVASCDPSDGSCVESAVVNGTPCGGDVDQCTLPGSCLGGVCQPGGPRTCPASTPCQTVFCDPARGCVVIPVDQGQACIGQEGLCCGGACQECCDDAECGPSNVCTAVACVAGACVSQQIIAEGAQCATGKVCLDGGCVGTGFCHPSNPLALCSLTCGAGVGGFCNTTPEGAHICAGDFFDTTCDSAEDCRAGSQCGPGTVCIESICFVPNGVLPINRCLPVCTSGMAPG